LKFFASKRFLKNKKVEEEQKKYLHKSKCFKDVGFFFADFYDAVYASNRETN
jgi:hypothetical protein